MGPRHSFFLALLFLRFACCSISGTCRWSSAAAFLRALFYFLFLFTRILLLSLPSLRFSSFICAPFLSLNCGFLVAMSLFVCLLLVHSFGCVAPPAFISHYPSLLMPFIVCHRLCRFVSQDFPSALPLPHSPLLSHWLFCCQWVWRPSPSTFEFCR